MKKLLSLFSVLIILGCEDEGIVDTTQPSSIITYPAENAYVTGTVEITCMASDNEGVSKVELWVNGIYSGLESTTEPFTFQWNTNQLDDNSYHTLVARAYDNSGNIRDSDPVIVTVIQNTDILIIQDLLDWNYLDYELLDFVNSFCVFTNVNGNSRLQSLFYQETSGKIFILPESFTTLTHLEYLALDNQNLNSLPDEFDNLSNLIVLELRYNELTSLPESIGNLSNLTRLDLQGNELTSLPESIENLNLTYFLFDGNQLYCEDGNENPPSWLSDFCTYPTQCFDGLYNQDCP